MESQRLNLNRCLILMVLLACCGSPNIEKSIKHDILDSTVSPNQLIDITNSRQLLQDILFKGDTISYKKGAKYYFSNERNCEFLYYALVMANKYDYSEAYFDVYIILTKPQTWNINSFDKLDKGTQKMALYYLLKSYEKGYKGAKFSVKNIFGDTPPNSGVFR